MRRLKSLKTELLYHPETSEEAEYRILRAYEILLPKGEIIKYLNSLRKVGKKSRNYQQKNAKSKTEINKIIT